MSEQPMFWACQEGLRFQPTCDKYQFHTGWPTFEVSQKVLTNTIIPRFFMPKTRDENNKEPGQNVILLKFSTQTIALSDFSKGT